MIKNFRWDAKQSSFLSILNFLNSGTEKTTFNSYQNINCNDTNLPFGFEHLTQY